MKKLIILLLTFTICGCNEHLFDTPFVVEGIKYQCNPSYYDCNCSYIDNGENTMISAPCGAYQIGDTIKLQE